MTAEARAKELEDLIAYLRALPSGDQLSVARRREVSDLASKAFKPPAGTTVEPWNLGRLDGEIVVPKSAVLGQWILYLHGGGYVAGSTLSHRHLAAAIAASARSKVLIINYRLAPEHPYPAAVEDSTNALLWLYEQTSPGKVAIVGDSAGGGLVFATTLNARRKGIPLPGALVAISPWADLTCPSATMESDDPMISGADMQRIAAAYLAGADPMDPIVSPVFADFRGWPPVLIQVSGAERIYQDGLRLMEVARASAVPVTLEIEPGAPHVWHWFWPRLTIAREAIDRLGNFIARACSSDHDS